VDQEQHCCRNPSGFVSAHDRRTQHGQNLSEKNAQADEIPEKRRSPRYEKTQAQAGQKPQNKQSNKRQQKG
jgi:hypothetical protein